MNKDWVHLNRTTEEYVKEAWNFVKMAEKNAGTPNKILCPCKDCRNFSQQSIEMVFEHLVIKGMDLTYTTWFHHGEKIASDENPEEVKMSDAFNLLKAINGWSDKSFNGLLEILHDMLPIDNVLLKSVYSMRKFLKTFDLGYEKIHACINDCYLFRKENENEDKCPICSSSRWQEDEWTKKIRKGVPAKVLRYFPIIPRFRRMFRSPKLAEDLRWHFSNKSEDGHMRHLVDSLAWDHINDKWPDFASDPCNLRLGLSTYGFNPFANLSSTYSCWPVMLVTYNLPPWLCMKK
ncbi:hypothetical protein LWI28_010509 [Acer negundo]|uniref:Transposase-associated domain-containing protein n=1 Tax=Acer negundo TaxID=4023 RepID=A0AAD5J5A0_ACENE|nr:hypothetical protein LWI28_010509 [Acer negundo]